MSKASRTMRTKGAPKGHLTHQIIEVVREYKVTLEHFFPLFLYLQAHRQHAYILV